MKKASCAILIEASADVVSAAIGAKTRSVVAAISELQALSTFSSYVQEGQADQEDSSGCFFVVVAPCDRVANGIPELSRSVGCTAGNAHAKAEDIVDSKAQQQYGACPDYEFKRSCHIRGPPCSDQYNPKMSRALQQDTPLVSRMHTSFSRIDASTNQPRQPAVGVRLPRSEA
jgi:hypothetical protein